MAMELRREQRVAMLGAFLSAGFLMGMAQGAKPASWPPLDRLEREIASTDAQIDNLVYELYGITAEERKIIEGTS